MSGEEVQISFPELIRKKRDGEQLSEEEVHFFVRAVKERTIQDCQIGAMLMAIWQRGMVPKETLALTREMMWSGELLHWPEEWRGVVVDKHSTGGVGDKVSLPLAPALAACGCKIPMISGRGLAHTGGTLDKLESVPGFNIHQAPEQIKRILDDIGCCIIGQSETLVPADKVLYAIRDATSTVDSIPLITGSVISKKGAESLSALVLDVKYGKSALYKDINSARKLAESLVTVGNKIGICTGAVLSRMDNPIGQCIGNSVEVMEAIECLKGRGPSDLKELVMVLGTVLAINGMPLAEVLNVLGAGRTQAGAQINHSIGAELLVSVGRHVNKGDPWIRIHYETPALTQNQKVFLQGALVIGSSSEVDDSPLVSEFILPK
ncbi:thymidine phosphorylase isoform X2 [Acipenser ruthenus]|uniref:thymidine phosphorylase isoform X2 n=1 Tax=Acipenser ruthenus TaxID=7906 RepID=UPI00145B5640|nr:thymidine phosphorylase isoform X2 [Acipenser ruthenus]